MKTYIPYLLMAFFLLGLFCWAKSSPSPKDMTPVAVKHYLDGFLKTEFDGNRLYLQIPRSVLGDTLLMVCHHDGYHHDYRQVVWTEQGDGILLEAVRATSLTGVTIPIPDAPKTKRTALGAFSILKERSGPKAVLIDITDLFFEVDLGWDLGTAIKDLSFIKSTANLDNETIIRTKRTTGKGQAKRTVAVDFSFFRLPKPMQPRLFDHRVGFFLEDIYDFAKSRPQNILAAITRWRLEKKHPNQAISVPITPIAFTLSGDIPEKWRPYVRAGILAWLPAFEAAGFKNAIMVNAPFERNNGPLESSVNHAIVRWRRLEGVRGFEGNAGSTVSSVIDLRSGEILKSDIIINSSLQHLTDDYFIRCAPLDKRAQQYPFPDDLMGELIQSVVSHETGHALGLMDANYGEHAYPLEKLRDQNWLERMGHTPSIMSYARDNNLPQPEDGIPASLLVQKVGPMDHYNIRWGYTPFHNTDFREEQHFLEQIVREQDTVAWYRYNKGGFEIIGPGFTNEVVESDDPIGSTALAFKNMERSLDILSEINKKEKDFALAERLYDKLLELWRLHLVRVMSMVGGYTVQYKSPSQEGNIYTPIPYAEQMEALDFFLEQALSPPEWLAAPNALKRKRYSTHPDHILEMQTRLLYDLLRFERLKRLEYLENHGAYQGITQKVLEKLQTALFKSFFEAPERTDTRTMAIQEIYISRLLKNSERGQPSASAEKNRSVHTARTKALFMAQLIGFRKRVSDNMHRFQTEAARGHAMRLLKLMKDL